MTRQSRQFSSQGQTRSDDREASSADRGDRTHEGYPRYERDEGWDRDEENARFGRNEGRFDQAWSRGRDEGWRGQGYGRSQGDWRSQGSGGTGGAGFASSTYGGGMRGGGAMSHTGYGGSMGGGNSTAGRVDRGDWFRDQDRFAAHGDVNVTQQMDRGAMSTWGGQAQYEHHQPHGGGIGSGWRDQGNARTDRAHGFPEAHANQGYGQQPYGQSSYGHAQNAYGQNPYGQNSHGQNSYAQNTHGHGPAGVGLQRGDAMGGWGQTSGGTGQDRPHLGKGPKGYTRSDERIREDVCDCLSDGYVDASNVEVDVKGGVVTLGGHVTDKQSKRQIEDMVEGCRGVKTVENQIRVQGETGAPAASSSTTLSSQGSTAQGSSNGEREDSGRGKNQRSSAS